MKYIQHTAEQTSFQKFVKKSKRNIEYNNDKNCKRSGWNKERSFKRDMWSVE